MKQMLEWKERPKEIANLLNPAFCGEVLRRTLYGYNEGRQEACPFLLLYLSLPIVLTKKIRQVMPQGNERPKMHPWLENNPNVKIGFASKVENYREITNEAILFLSKYNQIGIDSTGTIKLVNYKRSSLPCVDVIDHSDNIYKAAARVGLWFSEASGASSIFAMWGITL